MPRIAVVHKDRCNPVGCGDYLCMRVCPENRMGRECIVIDPVDKKIKINEEQCGEGVKIAAKRCPYDAIDIINLPEELCKQPIHRYGENGFRLYGLPIPQFGAVTGIIGRNGIGKSTAIKIIAGVTKPNFGTDKEASFAELMKFFKGTEAQNFFQKLNDGKITVAYKPQQVDLIPKTTRGSVRTLLEKADQRNAFESVVAEFQLENVLDSDITEISGGELQRVAIAATVLKKANLYIFDEPSSYLDIKQRIRIAKFIKAMASQEIAVVVIEHDLIILDYMTDFIQIMYGKESAYGIVSLPKAAKAGINVFLEGYIKEANMRFRDYPIKFLVRPPERYKSQPVLVEWPEIEAKLGSFMLETSAGDLRKHEVVGVLGENGIGKTTFVKILANAIKPSKGHIETGVKVSYKPQYIITNESVPVLVALGEAATKHETDIMRPLDIKHLLQKNLNELSGGELQRVAIAKCLSQEADAYLLDEPSAYLDVEQRMSVAKTIKDIAEKRGCSILVVDHDLIFIDYLSDKLILFEGAPAIHGRQEGPFTMEQGMNKFLSDMDVTMRRDQETHRPRINKPGSVMDREQKEEGKLYYT